MRAFLLFVLSFAVCGFSFAQSPLPDPELGTRPEAFSARSLGLGRTFLTSETGAPALLGNPATLAGSFAGARQPGDRSQKGRWLIDISGDIARTKETRSYPFYDSFDGVLNYNNYAINDHLYSKLNGGVSWLVPQEKIDNLVLALGSYSAYGFDYRYHEEVRSRFSNGGIQDLKLGDNKLDVTGDLRALSIGAAAGEKRFSAGFGVSFLSGSWSYEKSTIYTENYPDGVNSIDLIEYETDGSAGEFTLGLAYKLNERVTFGGRVLSPTGDFKFDQNGSFTLGDTVNNSAGTVTVKYPAHFALGIEYQPQHEFRPKLYLEGETYAYSDVRENYDDTFEIRAGAEQQLVPGSPVRLGFIYATSPEADDRATTLYTAGIGFHLQRLTGDFGVELGKLNYSNPDLFPQSLFGDTDRSDFDRVETALFRGLVTLKYAL